MLNVINGVYLPQIGTVTYDELKVYQSKRCSYCRMARTFQNIALFQGMTVLENIMTGRNLLRSLLG